MEKQNQQIEKSRKLKRSIDAFFTSSLVSGLTVGSTLGTVSSCLCHKDYVRETLKRVASEISTDSEVQKSFDFSYLVGRTIGQVAIAGYTAAMIYSSTH